MTTTASQESQPIPTGISGPMVYRFGGDETEGNGDLRNLLGGKGANLAEMARLGIPVPPGFTITTEVCTEYYRAGGAYPDGLVEQVQAGVRHIEQLVDARFGDAARPLLVSVRSGARVSMPGMMDTVLNLGLNDETVAGLAERSGNPRFAYDSYRRFIQMYGNVVMEVGRANEHEHDPFEELIEQRKRAHGVADDTELSADALRELVGEFKALVQERAGRAFPDDPWEQLWGAVGAVFSSWNAARAKAYRAVHGYPDSWGTAVNVQGMVFGNLGQDCATGVAFTRDAATGQPGLNGEYLINAQGEDVVAGIRTPQPIAAAAGGHRGDSLEEQMPELYRQFEAAGRQLEAHFGDMQDLEFTIQQGRLWVLQTRNGKRTAQAMVKIAVDLVDEGLIDPDEAVRRQEPDKLIELFSSVFDPAAEREVIARGLGASPGAAVGKVVFSAEAAQEASARDEAVILVRVETSPEDVVGMREARGILTARGGATSHAAVVARGWGKCCVTGVGALDIDYAARQFTAETASGELVTVREGDVISLDGTAGEVMRGRVPLVEASQPDEYHRLMAWADERRRLRVRANADSPSDAERAREFGAEGIGLCRTEHMFFGEERILAVRQMILAEDEQARRRALDRILPYQREDFVGILRAMAGFPVTIRLLDPPLHEFLPHDAQEIADVASSLGVAAHDVQRRVDELSEFNPMLGHRGVRLAITYPEIYEVQARAIMQAATQLRAEGVDARPEIMIPLVGMAEELRRTRALVERVAAEVIAESGVECPVPIGTMIELPRACVVADEVAQHADFFSFGTNDLTQTVFGLSRDDASRFMSVYIDDRVLERDPFSELDRDGVGVLMRMGIERGRSVRPDIKLGICGEHGGNPPSVAFCDDLGLDYVSASPFRVPIARLSAAQAAAD